MRIEALAGWLADTFPYRSPCRRAHVNTILHYLHEIYVVVWNHIVCLDLTVFWSLFLPDVALLGSLPYLPTPALLASLPK